MNFVPFAGSLEVPPERHGKMMVKLAEVDLTLREEVLLGNAVDAADASWSPSQNRGFDHILAELTEVVGVVAVEEDDSCASPKYLLSL